MIQSATEPLLKFPTPVAEVFQRLKSSLLNTIKTGEVQRPTEIAEADINILEHISASFTMENLETAVRIVVPIASVAISMWLGITLMEMVNPNKQKKASKAYVMNMLKDLNIHPLPDLTDHEVCIATSLIDPSKIKTDWSSVGGLNDIIVELQTSVILPFTLANISNVTSPLFRAPKGVLLYGPPGCGKTLLARAMASSGRCCFLNLQVHTLVNMWYGETQKLADAVFSLAKKLQPAIIFIDEIDSFLSRRSSLDHEATRMMKTQFMALWDGLLTTKARVMVVGATNRPNDLDTAILRRLPYKVHVPKPNLSQRKQILEICLKNTPRHESLDEAALTSIAQRTESRSGSDLEEICREAASNRFRLAYNVHRHRGDNSLKEVIPSDSEMQLKREDFDESINKFNSTYMMTTNFENTIIDPPD